MSTGPIAYLSAAKSDLAWAERLHADLERCLHHAGEEGSVFWEALDVGAGEVIPAVQQTALDRARVFLLVVTPEALADPSVVHQWQSFLHQGRHRRERKVVPVVLAEATLPPFLDGVQAVVFAGHDADAYRDGLARLAAAILGRPEPPSLPDDLEIPECPVRRLPADLRSQLVEWLAPVLRHPPLVLSGLASRLRLSEAVLLQAPSAACGASNAIVLHAAKDDPVLAALRLVDQLAESLVGMEPQERLAELEPLRRALGRLRDAGPPETGLLAAWRRKVHRDHERLVDFFQQRQELELLDRVYVELAIEAQAPWAGAEEAGAPERRPPERRGLRERVWSVGDLLELAPEERPWVTRRWLIRGDPGSGKTTLLRHLAARLAADKGSPWVPVFQSLPVLIRSGQSLLERIERQMGRAEHRGLAAVLDREGQEGRLLLLLDGLDEVSAEDREDAETLLRELAGRWPGTPLVVTTRPIGYRRFDAAFRELELLPFDRPRRLEFLSRWFGRVAGGRDDARAEAALAELDAPGLWDLSGNPLYLTLMALLLEQGQSPSRRRSELYRQVFELLLQGKHKLDREGFRPIDRPATVHAVLRHLAWGMTLENRGAFSREELEDRLYRDELEELRVELRKVPRWDAHLGKNFLDDEAHKVGILGPHDGEDADWRFWHRTFREALTAERLGEMEAAEVLALAGEIAGEESRWAEPFALLAGRVEEPDALIRSLVEKNRALALRALASAQGVSDEVLVEILELSGDWEERRKVFDQIPEQLGDAERALMLIDRLRRRTRDGNDLFFLDLAARAVADRWEGAEAEAERLRGRLYDHIDRPSEELFLGVETRDGTVDLWRAIPAGKFLMGSPEDEEERYDDEGPRHEVIVESPFRMAAVPVTVAQYTAFEPGHVSGFGGEVPDDQLASHPVDSVTWYQAVAFCRWLAAIFPWAKGARLPTEEEWEYACRVGTETRYWAGDGEEDLDRVGWYGENSGGRTHRAGRKPANQWGLYDVHGNVWEWTLTGWDPEAYQKRQSGFEIDPATVRLADAAVAAARGGRRVIRGGAYVSTARRARSAYRYAGDPGDGFGYQGFRVVLPRP